MHFFYLYPLLPVLFACIRLIAMENTWYKNIILRVVRYIFVELLGYSKRGIL